METESEIVLELEADEEPVPAAETESAARALPFSFAKRHGVFIRGIDGTKKPEVMLGLPRNQEPSPGKH